MLAAFFTVSAAHAATSYELIPLGSGGTQFKHAPMAISSNKRYVAGECFSSNLTVAPGSCMWVDRNFVATVNLSQGYGASFGGVNDAGIAVGYIGWTHGISRNLRRAVLWDGASASNLPSPFGDVQQIDTSEALGINQAGAVVGWAQANVDNQPTKMATPSGPRMAVVWRDGIAQTLPSLGGAAATARAINNLNVIVGQSSLADNTTVHATLWRDGQAVDIGGQAAYSVATGINDANQVVGYAQTSASSTDARAMLWQGGVATTLPALNAGATSSVASGINSSGLIVGSTTLSTGVSQAVLWEGGVAVNLNARLRDGSGGHVLNHAHAITDEGVIIGDMTNPAGSAAGTTGFMLVPTSTSTPQASCTVGYKVTKSSSLLFTAEITLTNLTNSALTPWAVDWTYAPGGYAAVLSSNANVSIKRNVTGTALPLARQASIAPQTSFVIAFTALSWGKTPALSTLKATLGGQACRAN